MSEIVNDALRMLLNEDEEDLAAFAQREHETPVSYGEFLARIKPDLRPLPIARYTTAELLEQWRHLPAIDPHRFLADVRGSHLGVIEMSRRAPRITGLDVIRALLRGGWYITRQTGAHVIMHHVELPGLRVTVPNHAGRMLHPKTLSSILDQARLTVEEFQNLL
jgi:predicted RNA binding protein YcfA (HicA-like mRNA interferase family)